MDELKACGQSYTTTDESLVSTSAFLSDSLVADSLGVDTITAVVRDYQLQVRLLAAGGVLAAAGGSLLAGKASSTGLKTYDYGAPVTYTHDGTLFGKFYLEKVTRVGPYAYQIQALSAIGLLLSDTYYGGIYTGISMADLVADIVHGIFAYTMDTSLGAQPVFGWLRKASRRDALRDVLFAMGGQIRKDAGGGVIIAPQQSREPYGIDPDAVYQGGSVAGLSPATAVWLTEHTFVALPNDEQVTLFDGEAAAEAMTTPGGKRVVGVLVDFSEPVHDLRAERVEILESGANYAVLGPSSSALLTGRKYTHIERVLSRERGTNGAPNVVSSNACTLVNLMNAENVLTRLMAYYGAASEITADLVLTDQRTGDAVTFTDPFGDAASGYIAELDVTMSAVMKARATIVAGYIPTAPENYYQHSILLTESGTFIAPDTVRGKIRVVLCSGAQGGEDGAPGESGGQASASSFGKGGHGGEAGAPGSGGRLCVYTISASPGQAFQVVIGKGGARGPYGTGGSPGGDTTFGSLSTADGSPAVSGYVDLLTGEIYATPGEGGVPGGSGNGPDGTEAQPVTAPDGTVYSPGPAGEADSKSGAVAAGGLGGGAAVGSDGAAGSDGRVTYNPDGSPFADGGQGGDGADAADRESATTPGSGGPGGHGGGGGGGGGPASSESSMLEWMGQGGSPGRGGLAGDGAPGFVIVYY